MLCQSGIVSGMLIVISVCSRKIPQNLSLCAHEIMPIIYKPCFSGIPLLYLSACTLFLESPSYESRDQAEESFLKQDLLTDFEKVRFLLSCFTFAFTFFTKQAHVPSYLFKKGLTCLFFGVLQKLIITFCFYILFPVHLQVSSTHTWYIIH